MTQQEWTNTPGARQPADDQTIDVEMLAHAVWRHRYLVIVLTVLGALTGYGASVLGTRYLSSGLLLTPDTKVVDYKRYEVAMLNEPRLEHFLAASGKQDEPIAALMRELVHEPGRMQNAVRPVFSFTERDAKQFGVKVEDMGELVGIELLLKQKDRTEDAPVLLLAEYVRDTAISVDLESLILKACLDNEIREKELRNEQLDGEFQIGQLEDRATRLRDIISRTPASQMSVAPQVVSVENGGEKFLPPATQLASTEIGIADRRVEEIKRERERTAAGIMKNYYCEARKLVEAGSSGRDLLLSLEGLQRQVMTGKDMSVNVIEQTANTLALQSSRWVNRYLASMRFVASPQGAQTRERKPGPAIGIVLGTALGGLFGVLLAIALAWWRQHRDQIVADDR